MSATGDRILAHIRQHGPASRQQLCNALGITDSCCMKNIQALRVGKKQLYRTGWQKVGTGLIPFYALGDNTDAPAPVGLSLVKSLQRPTSELVLKKCRKCGQTHPETPEFFAPRARHKNGLDSYCRDCRLRENADYRARTQPAPKQHRYDAVRWL